MLTRRLVLVSAALATLGLATAGCAEQNAAIRVGDETVSDSDFMNEVNAFGGNDVLLQLIAGVESPDAVRGELPDSYSQEFIGQVLVQRVASILSQQLLEDEGLEVTSQDRDAFEQQAEQAFAEAGEDFGDLPSSYRKLLIEDNAVAIKLQDELGQDGYQEALLKLLLETDVEVSSRYGRWDSSRVDEQQSPLIPPEGPLQPKGSEDTADPFGTPEG